MILHPTAQLTNFVKPISHPGYYPDSTRFSAGRRWSWPNRPVRCIVVADVGQNEVVAFIRRFPRPPASIPAQTGGPGGSNLAYGSDILALTFPNPDPRFMEPHSVDKTANAHSDQRRGSGEVVVSPGKFTQTGIRRSGDYHQSRSWWGWPVRPRIRKKGSSCSPALPR